ncbi:hypothetical protein J2Y69_000429 [Microbacterium resistens]|uniref:Tat pathway signal sequence domain protein n=1 Tax=Microbacterium resistens TaxID=156977 RepID=A0ABU1S8A7_9MICO|nr:hypothetical protein [Microbacterium resistens]MDR6865844.1 hypothetical protein [Microbacterium resistens]
MTNSESLGTPNGVRRRTVLKGAAWSMPVVAAAVALPNAAASTDCACFVPSTLGQGVSFGVTELTGGQGKVVYNSGFGIDGTQCAHTSQTYQVTVLSTTLTMSDGQGYTGTIISGGTTNNSFAFSHGAVPVNLRFDGVHFPDGNYSSFGGNVPVSPQSLTVVAQFDWDGKQCTKTLNYAFSLGGAGFTSGQVSGGTAVIGVSYQMQIVGA